MWVGSLCVYNFGQSRGCGRGQGRGWSHYACVCRQGQECGWGPYVCIILGRVVDVGGARNVGGVMCVGAAIRELWIWVETLLWLDGMD